MLGLRQRQACRLINRLGAIGLILLATTAVSAQGTAATPQPAAAFPRWDASGGMGLHYLNPRAFGGQSTWSTTFEPRLQIGRYFSSHLKTELSVSGPTTLTLYEVESLPPSFVAASWFGFTTRTVRTVWLAPALSYQFLDNVFAHPFVSAGINVGLSDEHRRTVPAGSRAGQALSPLPDVESHHNPVLLAPFVAGGFKSYFNDRVFVRPQIQVAFGPRAASEVGLRLDFGIDF